MKKDLYVLAILSVALVSLSSFKQAETQKDSGSEFVEKVFPKKHLIEEFTGQDCGYCPDGMNAISEFMENDTNWVLVLHHAGYSADHFTVNGSKYITNKLGVNGAPSSTINRNPTKHPNENGRIVSELIFHPGYLEDVDKSQFDTTTFASLNIKNEFQADSAKLNVHISGEIGLEDYSSLGLKLTVLVKESGMIDYQKDYYGSYEGWEEFRHANAVRVFLTSAYGDDVTIDSTRHYSADLSVTLNDTWVPENCMVVAFLSKSFKPVVQAAEKPVVEGTSGGADITHGGIKAVAVPDYYPEPNATDGPSAYSGQATEVMTSSNISYQSYPEYGFNYWTIQAANTSRTINVQGTTCIPFTQIFFFTELSQKSIPNGVFEFNSSEQPGTAYAGIRDDSEAYIGGSMFYFTSKSYYNQNSLVPSAQWLIVSGKLTISSNSWIVEGKTLNGSDIRISYGESEGLFDIENREVKNAKQIENGKLIILTPDGRKYNITGQRVK